MKTLHFLIIVILVASFITVSQSVFAQQTAKEILQQRDDAKKTGLVYNGTTLIVTQEINKTEFKTGERFSVTPHLVNMGNNVATIIHGDPLFEIKVFDGNGNVSFIWPDAIVDVGITETLEPSMSTSGRVISGNGGFPEIALDKLGNYAIYSIANINSEGMPAHMESIWSQPLKISILPENYTSQVNYTNSIHPIPSSILHSPVPILSPSENQSIVDAALSVHELQNWSHDWKYLGMGFGSNNKAASGDFGWQYASVVLKAPSSSAPFPCNNDWWATVVIDMTTMKVVQASYPTMESHSCQVITLGGSLSGGMKMSSNVTNIESPLKQFKSGVALKDIKCASDLQLIIKAKSRSPACVKSDDVSKLVERGWADKPNSLQEQLDFASVCMGMNDACRNRFDTQNMTKENQTASSIPQCVSNIQNQYAIAGPRGDPLCPAVNFQASGKIVKYTGFYGVYGYSEYLSTPNFVLEPGHNGTLSYEIDIGSIHNWGNEPPTNNVNITNDIEFMHDAGMNNHPGVITSVDSKSEIIQKNGSAFVTITFAATNDAKPGIYWVDLPPSFCAGGKFIILTITNCEK